MKKKPNDRPIFSRLTHGAIALLLPLLGASLLITLFALASPLHLYAQEEIGAYTVQSGDTLAEIAERFGVSLEQLIVLNQIEDRDLIAVGQVLLIPAADSALRALPTKSVLAKPGDTLIDVARRYTQEPQQLTALNHLSMTARLFPGQPIAVPLDANIDEPLHFGAIDQIVAPNQLVQGRTGQVTIESRRPVSIVATWNGLPLTFLPATPPADDVAENPQTVVTLLPVPALIAPAAYTLTLGYTTTNGIFVRQDRQIQVVEGPYDSQEIILPDEKGGLLAPEIVEEELARMTAVWSIVTPQWWWTAPFTRPIGTEYATTSPFGTRRSYNGGPYSSYHAGQDFGAPEGVPILAPAAGRVALAAPLQVRGNAVLLDHGGGVFTGYWHMSEIFVAEGQEVNAGDVLGLVGTTGLSTGAHLHWELRIYGIAVDPLQFLAEPLVAQ
ncbi:MAG: peptidoglycan DD-metalloendopeptidase family protein [Caldilineaceae bacterium]|nr:peptidoglycan DD-metalloendopeptidase family protein [Caldilineaceae bacterium]